MNRSVLSLFLCPMLAVAAFAGAPKADGLSGAPTRILGTYTLVPSDAADVQDARNFVQTRLAAATLGDVNVAYSQIVDGTNYKFVCTGMEGGQTVSWKFVAFRSLEGEWQLVTAERL